MRKSIAVLAASALGVLLLTSSRPAQATLTLDQIVNSLAKTNNQTVTYIGQFSNLVLMAQDTSADALVAFASEAGHSTYGVYTNLDVTKGALQTSELLGNWKDSDINDVHSISSLGLQQNQAFGLYLNDAGHQNEEGPGLYASQAKRSSDYNPNKTIGVGPAQGDVAGTHMLIYQINKTHDYYVGYEYYPYSPTSTDYGFNDLVVKFHDVGISTLPVPEPAFYQMGVFLAGGGLMALRLRRKNRQ